MQPKRYTSAGLVIESVFDLPGLYTAEATAGPAQLRYVHAAVPAEMDGEPLSPGLHWSADRKSLKFVVSEVAIFDISNEGTVRVSPLTANLGDIAAFLVGSVLGIALHLRKIVTIHASAVKVGDGAVLFCGESGAGKSTMAAALQQRGHKVLSDDLCALEISSSGVTMHSDGRKLKLWDEVIDSFGIDDRKGERVQQGFDKFFVEAGIDFEAHAPVRAVFELIKASGGSSPRVVKVAAAEAAALVRRNAYRPFLVEKLNDEALYFEAAACLLRCSTVCRLERAHRFDQIGEVIDALQRHW